jgi:hypothetical protein
MPSTRFWKYCPICLTNRVYRPEVRTCGSKLCVGSWRILPIEQRGTAVEKAQELTDEANEVERNAFDVRFSERYKILTPEEMQQTQSPTPAPKKEVMTDEEFLNKHVPGYLEKAIPATYGHAVDCQCEKCVEVRKKI